MDSEQKLIDAVERNRETVYTLPPGNFLKEICKPANRQELLDFLCAEGVLHKYDDGEWAVNEPPVNRRCEFEPDGVCGGPYFVQQNGSILCRVHNHAKTNPYLNERDNDV